jgi:hypothetical protein
MDWYALSLGLGETSTILAWFDAERENLKTVDWLRAPITQRVVPVLVTAGRWADAGLFLADPLGELRRTAERRDEMEARIRSGSGELPEEMLAEVQKVAGDMIRKDAASFVRALLAARRDDDAKQVAEEALRIDASQEMVDALEEARRS